MPKQMRKRQVKEGALYQSRGIPEDEEVPVSVLDKLKKGKRPRIKRPLLGVSEEKDKRFQRKRRKARRKMSRTEQSLWEALKDH